MEQNTFWLQISTLKTLFSCHLNLQLQSLKGNEILPSQPVMGESGHHHFFCSPKGPCPSLGDQSQAPPGIAFLSPQLCRRTGVGTLKEQRGPLQISTLSPPPLVNRLSGYQEPQHVRGGALGWKIEGLAFYPPFKVQPLAYDRVTLGFLSIQWDNQASLPEGGRWTDGLCSLWKSVSPKAMCPGGHMCCSWKRILPRDVRHPDSTECRTYSSLLQWTQLSQTLKKKNNKT